MPQPTVVVDTGPIVALVDADERHHDWARRTFDDLRPPLLTCEAVLSEASFLLRRAGADPDLPAALVERGVLRVAAGCATSDDARAVGRLIRRYANVPMRSQMPVSSDRETTAKRIGDDVDGDFRISGQRPARHPPAMPHR